MNPLSTQKRIAFGYRRGTQQRIEIYEGQAACVKLIFHMYLCGNSIASIKETLEGINAPSPYNSMRWSKQTLANILSNPHYTGSDVYPQIISEEDFAAVQKIKKSK